MSKETMRKPDDLSGIYVRGHIKISDVTDPNNIIVLENKNNAIHYENISTALAFMLANKDQNYIYEMHFGNGGTSVDPTGVITYLPPNTTGQSSNLYNATYSKVVDDTAAANTNPNQNYIQVRHIPGQVYTDILVTCLLDYGEPSNQTAFDNNTTLQDQYTFDELGLFGRSTDGTSGLSSTGPMLTHVIFHPVQKSLNRLIQIDYTVRIQTLTNLSSVG
jgi:hypothetical protein